jgi:hypothetical protein
MLVERDTHHVLRRILNQDGAFVVIAELEELLAQIITKGVRHELDDMRVGLEPNHMNLLRIAFLQLLLKIAASMLVLTQFIDLPAEGFKRHILVPRHGCRFMVNECVIKPVG